MRKIFVCLVMLFISACIVVADTIYLRDGSIIKGTFIGFENGSFIIETSRGDRDSYQARYVSRVVMDRPEIDSDSRSTRYPRRDLNRRLILNRTIDISAKQAWTDTGIDLAPNVEVEITTEGQIKIGERSAKPNGIRSGNNNTSRYPMPSEGLGAIIGKVRHRNGRDSEYFFIGSGKTMNIEASQIGRLYIGINDDYLPDNSGSFRVNVSVASRSEIPSRTPRQQAQRVTTVEVDAKRTWTDTGIELQRSAWVDITAEGRIRIGERSTGPDGISGNRDNSSRYPMPDKGLGAVIAKVQYGNDRSSDYIFVGSRIQTILNTDRAGRLYIGINDDYLRDNSGSFRVTVRW